MVLRGVVSTVRCNSEATAVANNATTAATANSERSLRRIIVTSDCAYRFWSDHKFAVGARRARGSNKFSSVYHKFDNRS